MLQALGLGGSHMKFNDFFHLVLSIMDLFSCFWNEWKDYNTMASFAYTCKCVSLDIKI